MGRVVFLGHGGFDPTSGSDVSEVLVPPGTSLKFFSDAGQALAIPALDSGRSDYLTVVKVWDHFKEAEKPVGPGGVTYNFRLSPETSERERDMALLLDWGPDTEVVSLPKGSDKFYLCTGSVDKCPTPKLNVVDRLHKEMEGAGLIDSYKEYVEKAEGSNELVEVPPALEPFLKRIAQDVLPQHLEYVTEGVPDSRWSHDCAGILSEYEGEELYWVACTSFVVATPELGVLDVADSAGPGLSTDDWEPEAEDVTEIRALNKKNIDATPKDGTVSIVAGGTLLLVGADHTSYPAGYMRRQADKEEGQIIVTKGFLGKGANLAVIGIEKKQELVKTELAAIFPGMEVTFP